MNGGVLLVYRSQRGKNKADAADSITGSAERMVKRWEARVLELEATVEEQGGEIRSLNARVRVLEDENHSLRYGANRLESQLIGAGLEPEWRVGLLGVTSGPA